MVILASGIAYQHCNTDYDMYQKRTRKQRRKTANNIMKNGKQVQILFILIHNRILSTNKLSHSFYCSYPKLYHSN